MTDPLPSSSSRMPTIGLGTWRIGESAGSQVAEVAAIRTAIDLGYRLFDTAEMYGEGGAEIVLGLALADAFRVGAVDRSELVIVSKLYPHHASRVGTEVACARSLERLGLDRIDIYLLHWRGVHPLAKTVEAFQSLREMGRIGAWGVSNFDVDDMEELWGVPGGDTCAVNQIYYALSARGPEFDLLPWHRHRNVATMAYSPIDQGALASHPVLGDIGRRLYATPAQVALAWLATKPEVTSIPKAVDEQHLRDNLASAALRLSEADLAELDRSFPPPARKEPLEMR